MSVGKKVVKSAAQPSDGPEPGARAFVWGTWGVLSLAAAAFVAFYGTNVPVWDDYAIVSARSAIGRSPSNGCGSNATSTGLRCRS